MRPEVAAQFELTGGITSVYVIKLGREFDLTKVTLAQAEQLVAAGCTRIRRKPALVPPVLEPVAPAADTTAEVAPVAAAAPGKARQKRGAAGSNRQPR